jgi:hypothetical protein
LFDFALWPLGGLVLWNLTMTMLAGLNFRLAYHRQISLMIDLALSGALFWLQGGCTGLSYGLDCCPYFDWGNLLHMAGNPDCCGIFSILEIASIWTGLVSPLFLQRIRH